MVATVGRCVYRVLLDYMTITCYLPYRQDAGLSEGTYVYGIADYGNIIAVAKDAEHVEHVW